MTHKGKVSVKDSFALLFPERKKAAPGKGSRPEMAVKEREQAGLFGGLLVHFGLDLFFNFRV